MSSFFSLFKANLSRSMISFSFLLSTLGVTIILLLTAYGWFHENTDVVYLFVSSISGGTLFIITGILPLFAFSTSFASEWEQGATSFWLIRTGVRNYSINKVLVRALTGFLTTCLGMLLFILLLRIKFPLFVFNSTGDPYAYLLDDGKPMIYLIYNIFHYSLSSALFAVTALWVSTYIPNRFIALASPLALYFVIFRFMTGLDIPQYLKINTIVVGGYRGETAFNTFLFKLIPVIILCGLMGFAAVRQIRRRILRD